MGHSVVVRNVIDRAGDNHDSRLVTAAQNPIRDSRFHLLAAKRERRPLLAVVSCERVALRNRHESIMNHKCIRENDTDTSHFASST